METIVRFIAISISGLLLLLMTASVGIAQQPQLVVQAGHTDIVNSVCFSPDGKTIASASGEDISSSNNTIKLWDVGTGDLLRTLVGHARGVNSVCFSPDGHALASGSDDDTIKLWDPATGRLLRTLTGHTSDVTSVCFSPDGRTLASSSDDHTIKFWDWTTGALLHGLTDPVSGVESLCYSPDGRTLASGGIDGAVRLWDLTDGQLLKTFTGDADLVWSVCFSPDGRTLASGSQNHAINLWDPATGRHLKTLIGSADSVNSVCFSPDSRTLASGCDDHVVRLWNAQTGRLLRKLTGHAEAVRAVCFSPNGRVLATGSLDHTVRLWDTASGHALRALTGKTFAVSCACFSPDSALLADSGTDRAIELWDMATGQRRAMLTGHRDLVNSVCFSPDSRTLASGSDDNTIKLWDTQTGRLRRTIRSNTNAVWSVAFSPDGRMLAGGGGDGTIKCWNAATGRLLRTIQGGSLAVMTVCFSPNNRILASGSEDHRIKLWDTATGRLRGTLAGHTDLVDSVCFSPDGSLLASGSDDDTIKLWDTQTGQLLQTLTGHTDEVRSVCFSSDGEMLASGSDDHTIKIWDIPTGRLATTLSGDNGEVRAVSLSRDGRALAGAGLNGTVNLWSFPKGRPLCSLYAFGDGNWTVVSPDGRFDSSTLDNIRNIHWVLPGQPFTPVPVEAFFRQYYTPGLMAHLVHSDPLPPVPDIAAVDPVQPVVTLGRIAPHPGASAFADVTVSYAGQAAQVARMDDGTARQETSGVYDLRLFRNGQLVGALPPDALTGAAPTDLAAKTAGKVFTHTFTVRLPRDGAKSVTWTAYAFNGSQVKSRTATLDYTLPHPLAPIKGRAWVLAFGANVYDDPALLADLHYSVADALSYGRQLVPLLKKTGCYSHVIYVPMVSGLHAGPSGTLPASKAALRAVLRSLAGKAPDAQDAPFRAVLRTLGVTQAMPEDMVLLAFSCHGDTDPATGEYYLFPARLGPSFTRWPDPQLARRGISSAELTQWMQDVDAGPMAMVIDSCHSAAAAGAGFKPGPMDSPGLGQLAFYKRMRILSASAANESAKEYADLGHGLLTAALVEEGLVRGEAKPDTANGPLTLGPWLAYAEAQVPVLDAREQGWAAAVLKSVTLINGPVRVTRPSAQTPSLFDFHSLARPDAVIAPPAAIP